jgi:hypothetical protein
MKSCRKCIPDSNPCKRSLFPARSESILILAAGLLLMVNCDNLVKRMEPDPQNNAFLYLKRRAARQKRPNMDAVQAIIAERAAGNKSTDSLSGFEPGSQVMRTMRKSVHARRFARPGGFQRIDFSRFGVSPKVPLSMNARRPSRGRSWDSETDVGDLSLSHTEYSIPNIDNISVKNQGGRGTCAAFAGTGALEYSILEHLGLETIDLSEQRFYYMAKPECHDNGCSLNEEGSWYTSGLTASLNGPDEYDIPSEEDCPYNSSPGKNDLQIPQAESCKTGTAKVLSLNYVTSLNEIVATLESGHAVPFASYLSDNWISNNGLITRKGSEPDLSNPHSGGHAYLIVGYRQLDNMPEEGGMCFLIKNSWGTWWGVNGYACMTLAWAREWGWEYSSPVVMNVRVRDGDYSIDNEKEQDSDKDDEIIDDLDDEINDDDTIDWDNFDEEDFDNIPDPDPPPGLLWEEVDLLGPGDNFYRFEKAEDNDKYYLRGILRKTDQRTNILEFRREGNYLFHDYDEVGEVLSDYTVLCSESYDLLCSLYFYPEDNHITILWRNKEMRRVTPEELGSGEWQSLFGILGFGLEIFIPTNLIDLLVEDFLYLRMTRPGGQATEPLRFRITSSGKLRLMGVNVGDIDVGNLDVDLCSGSYAANCSLFIGRYGMEVLPTW